MAAANWTGWYLGGNVGSVTGRGRTTLSGFAPVPVAFSPQPDGINGGGPMRYKWVEGQ